MRELVLETHGVGVTFAAPVLHDVNLRLGPGWTGLVGANGAGKTTLLRVLAGDLTPTEGAVRRRPEGALLVVCPQGVEELTEDVRRFAEEPSALSGRLALSASDLDRWPTLSPGERKRWQIGAALHRDPDVLLVDEPTNHLDAQAKRLLTSALRAFRGIGVIVSHDRDLLDDLPHAIVRVHDGAVRAYPGGLADASRAWEGERARAEQAHAEARRHVRAIAERLDDARREQASADHARSSRTRMKNTRDHDARSALAKGRAAAAEARRGRDVTVVRAELARAETSVPRIDRDRTMGSEVFARFERAPSPILFHLDRDALEAGGVAILRDVRVSIGREDRVRIAGPNGAGKTTLLAALLRARRDSSSDRVLYLPQELPHAETAAHLEALAAMDSVTRGRVLSVFAALGSDPARIGGKRHEASLSPGEARKLALARGLGTHAWALVLDEPTNHLDLPTIERLERALVAYPGCLVLVSHDDRFARALTTRTLELAEGAVI